MSGFKESFVNLSEHESPHKVKLGGDYQYPIKGSGEANYKLDSEKSMKMKDVLFVPGLKKNILSISGLHAKGMRVASVDGKVPMWPNGKTIDDAVVIGEKEGGLYKLKGQPKQALVHDLVEPSKLWHRRLAHVNYRALPLARKVVEGIPEIHETHEGICKGFVKGKNTKKTFPSRKSKEKGILETIHSDVCGSTSSSSLSGYVYYVSFIDYFSRDTWIYFLENKDEVFSKFKEFKSLIENYTEKKIKTF